MPTCPVCSVSYSGAQSHGGHCMECHQNFSNDDVGDMHRIGPHGTPQRRCRTPEEMLAKGWRVGKYGWTRSKPMTAEVVAKRVAGATVEAMKPQTEGVEPQVDSIASKGRNGRCIATTRNGARCKKNAMKDSDLCQVHNPESSYQDYLRKLKGKKVAPITYYR